MTITDRVEKEMKGIYSNCITAEALDEAHFAYHSIEEIKELDK